jgi:DNA polymerase
MFGLTMEQVTKAIRQKGKVAELALGYAGGPNALVTMGALSMGLTKEELPGLVKAWRNANKNVVKLWRAYESSFKRAIDSEGEIFTGGKCAFVKRGMWLYVTLPSGRKLSYYNPRLEDGRFSEKALCYDGVEKNMFVKIETHGGKIAENICQAACRDLLRDCLFGMEEQNLKVVMHVHDEAVIEGEPCLDLAEKIMGTPSTWADGLPLRGDGYVTEFYKKDD